MINENSTDIWEKIFWEFWKISGEEKSKVKVKELTLTRLWLYVKLEWKKVTKYYKNFKFSETREKDENFHIKIMIFREELDLRWCFQNQQTENHRTRVFGQNPQIDYPNDIQI